MKNSYKKTFFLVFLIFIFSKSDAQVFPYTLETEMGTYTNLSGATELTSVGDNWDDPNYPEIPLGFNINFFSNFTNSVFIDDYFLGGIVSFGDLDNTPSSPLILAYLDDLMDVENSISMEQSTISYLTEGQAGSRIFKMEWNNCGFYDEISYVGTSNNRISLQLWIYEGSENIEIRFGPSNLPDPTTIHSLGSPFIGLMDEYDGATDEIGTFWFPTGDPTAPTIAMASNDTELENAVGFTSEPADGMIYRFANIETSTKTLFKNLNIKIYPTLVESEFFVEMDQGVLDQKTQLVVINNLGQEVYSKIITSTKEQLDASNFPKGIYHVSVINEAGSGVQKIIKN